MAQLLLIGMFDEDAIGNAARIPGKPFKHLTYQAAMKSNWEGAISPGMRALRMGVQVVRASGAEEMTDLDIEQALKSNSAADFKSASKGRFWTTIVT